MFEGCQVFEKIFIKKKTCSIWERKTISIINHILYFPFISGLKMNKSKYPVLGLNDDP